MIELYLRIRAHQQQMQQQQELLYRQQLSQAHHQQPYGHQYQQQQLQHQQQQQQLVAHHELRHDTVSPINLSTSSRHSVDRTYAELQTVRPGVAGDASEVLRRHNDVSDAHQQSSPGPGTSVSLEKPAKVKYEVILPNTPSYQDSVVLKSVRPGPSSVSAVPSHVPASGRIGRGNLFITAQYQKSMIGPIYVETEHELKAVSAIIQQKVAESKSKLETGSKLSFAYSSEGLTSSDDPTFYKGTFLAIYFTDLVIGAIINIYFSTVVAKTCPHRTSNLSTCRVGNS